LRYFYTFTNEIMTKGILYLIQYLVLNSAQMVPQIAVYNDLNDEQKLKVHIKKGIHVKNCVASKEVKAIKKKISKI
jgi:hypothetical protein